MEVQLHPQGTVCIALELHTRAAVLAAEAAAAQTAEANAKIAAALTAASVVVESAPSVVAAPAQQVAQNVHSVVTSTQPNASETVTAPSAATVSVETSTNAAATVPPVAFFEPHTQPQPQAADAPLSTSHRTRTMFVTIVCPFQLCGN
jgi:hypothetical protein